jgi:anthranilate phosphoribosyltransferase
MRFLAPARSELGVATTFNFLGPLANPARVRRQAVGVSDAAMAERMLEALRALGAERALVFRGDDGLDELTTTTTSTVNELLDDGEIRRYTLDPTDFGLTPATSADLVGGDATHNAARVHEVLAGETGPVRDIAVLNAAAAIVVAGIAPDIEAGIEAAAAAIADGSATKVLDALVRVSSEAQAATEGEA